MKRFILIGLIQFLSFSGLITAQEIVSLVETIQLTDASIWGNIVFNGENISATTTSHINQAAYLYLRKLDADMNQVGDRVQLTFDSDPQTAKKITDHKILFLNGHHYVTFSTELMDLYIFKVDNDGQRIGDIVTVIENPIYPTNDMMFTTDSTFLYVGYFKPPGQTIFHKFDLDLNPVGGLITTDEKQHHNNIGSVIFHDNQFYMFTGDNFGHNTSLLLTQWHPDWSAVMDKGRILIQSQDGDGNFFSTGLVYDEEHQYWIVAFQHLNPEDAVNEEHIDIVVFDKDFILMERQHVTDGSQYRPCLLKWNESLYMIYDGGGVYMKKFLVQERNIPLVDWKPFFTLDPDEGTAFTFHEDYLITDGGVPVLAITPESDVILSYSGGPGMSGSFHVQNEGLQYEPVDEPMGRAPDGGVIYLPDGRLRFVGEEIDPNSTQEDRRSRIVSSISYDGIHWNREPGTRYQPVAADDSISSVPSVIQVQDSVWRMYYVGDFYRTNGIRTAISTDWGWTWQPESGKNILRNHDVDPHAVHLSDGRVRLYHRHMRDPGGIGYTDGDGLVFDTTQTQMVIPDGTIENRLKLDPAVMKFPNGEIACYLGAPPVIGNQGLSQLLVAWADAATGCVDCEGLSSIPQDFALYQNVPNPFNPSTTIHFQLRKAGFVRIEILDIRGRRIKTVLDMRKDLGFHSVRIDGGAMSTGIYLYQLSVDGVFSSMKKMMLLR